jgi:uncharacterized protein YrzB (UPF0473 family)
MTEQDQTPDYEVVEGGATAITSDGTVVSEDVIAILDDEGNPALLDDLVTVEAPDGSAAFDEVISIADEDGNMVPVDETVGVMDTDGNITIAEATAD